jgi:hypothetical protein
VEGRAREDWREALPRRGEGRVLFGIGFAALLVAVPVLWMYVLYAAALPPWGTYAAAIGLCALAAGLGRALIGMLEERS